MDFNYHIERAKRRCKCRYCEGEIIKGEQRVSETFQNRFGWNVHHYHPYCVGMMLIELHDKIEKKVKKMLMICGFVEDDSVVARRCLQDLLDPLPLAIISC